VSAVQWSSQQDQALTAVSRWLADAGGAQVFRLFGWAGTGKSTLAKHLAEGVETVRYAAFTGKAALVMRKRGCRGATTIHSLIYSLVSEKEGEPKFILDPESAAATADLIVIDEVSMVDEQLGRDLLSFGTKVLVLGDPFQLPPVQGAGFFTATEPDLMLTEIHRQAADNPIIRLSMDIREGRGLERGEYGSSRVIASSEVDRNAVLAADQVLAGRNKTRLAYNDRIRELKGLPHQSPVVGDRLVCLRNNPQKRLLNGQIWIVGEVKKKTGGRIDLTLNSDEVAGARSSEVKVRTHGAFFSGQEETLSWPERRQFDEFTFGYCLTVHKAQGSQWDDVHLFDESWVFREERSRWLYTGVTRAAEKITIVS
jgi:ATP-dependent exoDNAse (exonuclease V) alpha subunit